MGKRSGEKERWKNWEEVVDGLNLRGKKMEEKEEEGGEGRKSRKAKEKGGEERKKKVGSGGKEKEVERKREAKEVNIS